MIGIIVKNHKIIAAIPIANGEEGHMIVVGKSLPQMGKRHSATFVTWFTDGQGVFDSPTYFTEHGVSVSSLRGQAIGDMINRAGWTVAAILSRTLDQYGPALHELEKR